MSEHPINEAAKIRKVLTFSGSKEGHSPVYMEAAAKLGTLLGENPGIEELVYGGGIDGLMGAVSGAAAKAGCKVTGVLPEAFRKAAHHVAPPGIEEHVVETLMERKTHMLFLADAAIILPGGIGTFDEFWEIVAAQDLRFYDEPDEYLQPAIVLNMNGFFDGTKAQFETAREEGFIKEGRDRVLHFVDTPEEVITILDQYNKTGRLKPKDLTSTPHAAITPRGPDMKTP